VDYSVNRLVALSAIAGIYDTQVSSCPDGVLLRVYYAGQLVILCILVVLTAAVAYISSSGTILDPTSRRRRLPALIVLRAILVLPEIAWTAVGTAWAFQPSIVADCPSAIVSAVEGAVIVGWIVLAGTAIGFFIVFDPLGRRRHQLRQLQRREAEGDGSNSRLSAAEFTSHSKRLWTIRSATQLIW
jgi:hypothetical protein